MEVSVVTSAAGAETAKKLNERTGYNNSNMNSTGFRSDIIAVNNTKYRGVTPSSLSPFVPDAKNNIDDNIDENRVDPLATAVPKISSAYISSVEGDLIHTKNKFDFAIVGAHYFFTVLTKDGTIRYTRDGRFLRNADGFLVTQNGDRVLSNSGDDINLGVDLDDNNVQITDIGDIYIKGASIARFGIAYVRSVKSMRNVGQNLLSADDNDVALSDSGYTVIQHATESSNVSSIDVMYDVTNSDYLFKNNLNAMKTINTLRSGVYDKMLDD